MLEPVLAMMHAGTAHAEGRVAMFTLGIKSRAEIGGRLRVISRIAAEAAVAADEQTALMQRNRRKVTIRQLMMLIALWAVVMGTWRLHRWCAYCIERAEYHGAQEALHRYPWPGAIIPAQAGLTGKASRPRPELADYHFRMRQKWERAAAWPWLSVEPDPPPPSP